MNIREKNFDQMQTCMSKISGKISFNYIGLSNNDEVHVWVILRTFGFYKFEFIERFHDQIIYKIYDEHCIFRWKDSRDEANLIPMEVSSGFFSKNFIVMEKFPGSFDGPAFKYD